MVAIRWFALLLFAVALGVGCGPRNPDTDPTDTELQVPNVDDGNSSDAKSDAKK